MQVECGTLCLSWGWAGSGLVCICDTTVFACVIYHIYLYATAHFLGFLCSCSGNDEEQTKKSFFLPSCLLQVAKSGLRKVQGVEPPTCYPGQSDSVVPGPGRHSSRGAFALQGDGSLYLLWLNMSTFKMTCSEWPSLQNWYTLPGRTLLVLVLVC